MSDQPRGHTARRLVRGFQWVVEDLDRLDRINTQLGITGFATLVYAELKPVGDGHWAMRWAVAGHLPPLLVADGASVLLSQAVGGALIQMPTETRRDAQVNLPVGATLLLYTDGLVERRGIPIGDTLTGLTVAAAAKAALPVDQFCDNLLDDAPTDDDIAMLSIRVRPPRNP